MTTTTTDDPARELPPADGPGRQNADPPDADPPSPKERSQRPVRRRMVTALVVLLTIGLGFFAARAVVTLFRPHLYSGTVLRAAEPAPAMDGLTYSSGEPVDLATLEDDVVLVYFGYTHCPDVCPTTLSIAAAAIDKLSASEQERTRLLMISVDPERDPVADLDEYVEHFHTNFAGVGGDPADIERTASLYGVFYERRDGSAASGYLIDHTATLLGIGTDGRLRVVWAPDVSADQLAADLSELH